MSDNGFRAEKKYPFPHTTRGQWNSAAQKEWQGEAPQGAAAPYYDIEDLPAKSNFEIPPSKFGFSDARAWLNMPLVSNPDDRTANAEALAALNAGADGILFEVFDGSDPAILLDGIGFTYCGISFLAKPTQEPFFYGLERLCENRNYQKDTIRGAIFWSGLPQPTFFSHFKDWSSFHAFGIAISDSSHSDTHQLAQLLRASVQYIEASKEETIVTQIAFYFQTGVSFFETVAELKALRALWYQIAKSYFTEFSGTAFIHAFSPARTNQALEPHSPMLNAATSAMSAVMGGCDALTIFPEDASNSTLRRISLNVSTILREESHFSKVADPTAGSFYLEQLTDHIARAVWNEFQRLL